MADITDFGRNPGRILAGQLAFVERHTGQRVRIVAESAWVGRSASEYLACMQHEALANIAFAGTDITGLCPYDASCLDASVLADVRLTHPQIWLDGSRRDCPEYAVDAALVTSLGLQPAALAKLMRDIGFHPNSAGEGWVWRGRERRRRARNGQRGTSAFAALAELGRG